MEALWWSLLVTVVAAALWRWMRRTNTVVGDFKGKVVWITGASSGLGEGAKIIIFYIKLLGGAHYRPCGALLCANLL